jgi:ArsR family transcriptional regulator
LSDGKSAPMDAVTGLRWVDRGRSTGDHPGGEVDVVVHDRAPSFLEAMSGTLGQILILVNIDIRRYHAGMARSKTTLLDPDVRLFQALADPTRLAIVRELAGAPEVCACDFTTCCDVRQPTVSHHLRVLREAGVVETERRGTWIYYRLAPAAADRLRALASELSSTPQLIPVSALRRPDAAPQSAEPLA